MKFLESKVHGYLDYAVGTLLLFIPSIFQLEVHTAQSIIFYILGIAIFFLSLQTDYEFGLYKILPMEIHVFIEILLGLFMILSPWIFGFSHKAIFPHLLFGFVLIILGLATKTEGRTLNRIY